MNYLNGFQDKHVGVIVFDKKLHVCVDGDLAAQYDKQLLNVGLQVFAQLCLALGDHVLVKFFEFDLIDRHLAAAGSVHACVHGLRHCDQGLQQILYLEQELLCGALIQVQAELKRHQTIVRADQILQHNRHLFRLVQIDQTLHHVHIIRIGQVRIDLHQHLEHRVAKFAVLNQR